MNDVYGSAAAEPFYIDRTFSLRKNLRFNREKSEDYVPLWMNLEKCKKTIDKTNLNVYYIYCSQQMRTM